MSSPTSCLSVSALNRMVKECLETNFPVVWLEGEVSNFKHYPSGHMYFKLKDKDAQVNCVFFAGHNRLCRFSLNDGLQIRVRAKISLYPERGDFQVMIELAEAAGDGALRLAFEQLQAKLRLEGLFDAARKRQLPYLPKAVGLITSLQGAVVRDMVTTLKRRFPSLAIIIYPAQVQGLAAVPSLLSAIAMANARKECEVLIIGRGGGSLEDLQAFNDESVARAIAASVLPIMSAVGHETDVTIADLVADIRAPTPTAAAELVSPHYQDIMAQLLAWQQRLQLGFTKQYELCLLQLKHLQSRLKRPDQQLVEQSQRLDVYWQQLQQAWLLTTKRLHIKLGQMQQKLERNVPTTQLHQLTQQLTYQYHALNQVIHSICQQATLQFQRKAAELETLSPLQTLIRGYSITTHAQTGKLIKAVSEVARNDKINVRLARGQLICLVEEIEPHN